MSRERFSFSYLFSCGAKKAALPRLNTSNEVRQFNGTNQELPTTASSKVMKKIFTVLREKRGGQLR